MSPGFDIHQLLDLLSSAAWILLDLALAAAVLYRFRFTAAGVLMGGAFALMALKNLVSKALYMLVIRPGMASAGYDYGGAYDHWQQIQSLYFLSRTGLTFVLVAVLAIGILLIPSALRTLGDRATTPADYV